MAFFDHAKLYSAILHLVRHDYLEYINKNCKVSKVHAFSKKKFSKNTRSAATEKIDKMKYQGTPI